MRINKWIPAATAVMGMFAAVSASALTVGDTVYVSDTTGSATNPFDTANLFRGGFTISNFGVANATTSTAGLFNLSYSDSPAGPWTKFLAFCLEPDRALRPYDTDGYLVLANPNNSIAELWGEFFDMIDTATEAAAFQLAIWELVVDGLANDLSSGDFAVTGGANANANAAIALAASWLGMLDGEGDFANLVVLNSLEEDREGDVRVQDLITEVPEPGSLALLGLGLLGLGLSKRRRA